MVIVRQSRAYFSLRHRQLACSFIANTALGEESVNHCNERISHAKGYHHTYDDLVAIPVWLLFHSSSPNAP